MMAAAKRPKKLWYVLAVEPGRENRIRREIARQAALRDLKRDVGRVIVKHHTEERFSHRDGKWKPMRVKSYPGYVLINLRYTSETHHLIKSLGYLGVFGFLNLPPQLGGKRYPRKQKPERTPPKKWELEARNDWKPTPVSSVEVAFLILDEQAVNQEKKDRKKMIEKEPDEPKYAVGDEIEILTGTFMGFAGRVTRSLPSQDGQSLTVAITVMGRETKIGIGSGDVKKKGEEPHAN